MSIEYNLCPVCGGAKLLGRKVCAGIFRACTCPKMVVEVVNDRVYRVHGVRASTAGIDAALEKLYGDCRFNPTIIAFCKEDYDCLFTEILAAREPCNYPISPFLGAYGNRETGVAMFVRLLQTLRPGTIQLWSGSLREAESE